METAMRASSPTPRRVIGWREWLALPELGIERIKAKVDTGARSSALHAFDIEYFAQGGESLVRFKVHPIQRDHLTLVTAEATLIGRRAVMNSGGRSELRPVVRTILSFMGEDWPIELTLTRRDVMGFRMLLGRQALRCRYVVAPDRSYVGGRPSRRRERHERAVLAGGAAGRGSST
jgi:hypothetical protein